MNTKTLMYILKRIALALLTVWVVITVTFFVMRAVPGGPFLGEKAITESAQAALEAKYGLDKPLMEQYFTYLKDVVTRFDFGPSLKLRGRQVLDIIVDGMKVSVKLGLTAAGIALVCGIVLGAAAALRRNKLIDKVIMVLTTACISMPSFIMGTLLLLVFALQLAIFPANGETAKGLILPIITLSLSPMANITRLTRSSMLDVLGQDYIRTARAKGLPEKKVIYHHAFRNTLIPLVTFIGGSLPGLFAGALITETLFGIPGIGYASYHSMISGDIPFSMFYLVFLAVLTLAGNLISDILYAVVDPRVRIA